MGWSAWKGLEISRPLTSPSLTVHKACRQGKSRWLQTHKPQTRKTPTQTKNPVNFKELCFVPSPTEGAFRLLNLILLLRFKMLHAAGKIDNILSNSHILCFLESYKSRLKQSSEQVKLTTFKLKTRKIITLCTSAWTS